MSRVDLSVMISTKPCLESALVVLCHVIRIKLDAKAQLLLFGLNNTLSSVYALPKKEKIIMHSEIHSFFFFFFFYKNVVKFG